MKRKEFLHQSLGVLVSIPALGVLGCSSSDSGDGMPNPNPNPNPNPQANCLEDGTNSTITANHGHSLSVSKGDVMAGTQKTYSIQGSSPHSHNVTLTSGDFASLQANDSITVLSTAGDGHTHNVTVSCA